MSNYGGSEDERDYADMQGDNDMEEEVASQGEGQVSDDEVRKPSRHFEKWLITRVRIRNLTETPTTRAPRFLPTARLLQDPTR